MGTGSGGTEAMEMVSVTQVVRIPWADKVLILACSEGEAIWLWRAARSPAMRERASRVRVVRKLSLKPRTPTRAATPTATERTTKTNLPGAERRSRPAMTAARDQLRGRLAI